MATPTRDTLRRWNAALSDDAIDPYDPQEKRYVKLSDAGRGAVDELQTTIELAFEQTTQLLSGPTGSGKTTELNRLRGALRDEGYLVTYLDLRAYVSTTSPVDITEFLVALGLAAYDAYGVAVDGPQIGFASRFGRLLSRLKVDLDIGGIKVEASTEGASIGAFGAKASVDLKRELKSSEPFVQELRNKLAYHVGELYADVDQFLGELAITATDGTEPSGYVLIVDGLEQLRGTTANDAEVQESVERLFVAHATKLRFSSHHVVYSVPTYLRFTSPGALPYSSRVLPVPTPYVSTRAGHEAATEKGMRQSREQLREVAARRLPVAEVFGHGNGLDAVISASGGHLRDLFKLLRQVVGLILRRSMELPVPMETVEEAIQQLAYDFGSVTQEQAAFLAQVDVTQGKVTPSADEVGLMARLLQTHMLLSHLNGSDWYEVHPLAKRALGLD